MSKIDWGKAPGAQFFVNGTFFKYEQDKWFWSGGDGSWGLTAYKSPENFSWWGFRVEAPIAWNGEGLPPVGAVCERLWSSARNDYVQVRVLAHDKGQAIFRFISGERIDEVQADAQGVGSTGGSPIFRPVRTPEQIAAEKLKQDAIALFDVLNPGCKWHKASEDVQGRYIAAVEDGYRKQEQP